ncbi:GntR family transcriptional regulator [Azospirillum sp. ST 5-10]|uniref:GntR family transcriptional regulator n=1 Tax=unclassified Azospirillum TaxID=2630922 RepID=UPI003F49E939
MSDRRRPLLRAGTTVDQMVQVLADEIVRGILPPGGKLDEGGLAERFGVSRTPVREALRQLSTMGLAERPPNRRAVVGAITDERLSEMFDAMGELEGVCAGLAARRMTAAERRALDALHQGSAAFVRDGARAAYEEVNVRFHTLLYDGAHCGYLRDFAAATRTRLAPFRRAQFRVDGRLAKSWDEHDAIVTAILRGDAAAATAAARAHVLTVGVASATFLTVHRTAVAV